MRIDGIRSGAGLGATASQTKLGTTSLHPDYWPGLGGMGTAVTFVIVALAVALFLLVWSDPSIGDYGPRVPFPEIRNWQSLRITLSRGLCYGWCPSFDLVVSGDGTISYTGRECVAVQGERTAHISPSDVAALVARFRAYSYFSLRDRYVANVPDVPEYRTSIDFDGHHKSVVDNEGRAAYMPQNVNRLENEIEKISGVDRWVYGTARYCFGQRVD